MEILGKAGDRYIAIISETEIANAIGYSFAGRDFKAGIRLLCDDRGDIKPGSKFDIAAARQFHEKIIGNEARAKEGAAQLRALATMIESSLPSIMIPASTEENGEPTK